MRDLLLVAKNLVSTHGKKEFNINEESTLQQILLLICTLIYSDVVLLRQFHEMCVFLNLFQYVKSFFLIRTKADPLSVVKYTISIFTRLYVFIPQSRQPIHQAFESCITGKIAYFIFYFFNRLMLR